MIHWIEELDGGRSTSVSMELIRLAELEVAELIREVALELKNDLSPGQNYMKHPHLLQYQYRHPFSSTLACLQQIGRPIEGPS